MSNRKPFLTAEWRHLLMLNYDIEPTALEPLVPPGTTLDTYQGTTYASLVAFLFLRTRLLGVPIPFHQEFEEVNLRFYVRRFAGGDWRRGVVFIKELVPKLAVALTARLVYNENYESLPMRHALDIGPGQAPSSLRYEWEDRGRWNGMRAQTAGEPHQPAPGSLEEFITEHYWGYARQKDGSCVEYEVEHPRWQVWQAIDAGLDCDAASAPGGEQFAPALSRPPASAFVADGSAITVFQGNRL